MRVIVSTIGTSLLTNQTDNPEERALVNKFSNFQLTEYDADAQKLLERIKRSADEKVANSPQTSSAELNGLLCYYRDNLESGRNDIHWLITTDTYQGKTTAEIVQRFLISAGIVNVQIYAPEKMSTSNKLNFLTGIKDLLNWCDTTLRAFKTDRYEIIFNLTGGFKSLQGYMNTIGMFYADKIMYIFEGSSEIIEIPKLPILIDERIFHENAALFAQMHAGKLYEKKDMVALPDTLFEDVDQLVYGFSGWGQLVWNNIKEQLLAEKLLELPLLVYEERFKSDFKNTISAEYKLKLQETLAKVSVLLQENNGDVSCLKANRAGGVLYDNYAGKNRHLGHFRVTQSERVTCQALNGKLYLRRFGGHETERNP